MRSNKSLKISLKFTKSKKEFSSESYENCWTQISQLFCEFQMLLLGPTVHVC